MKRYNSGYYNDSYYQPDDDISEEDDYEREEWIAGQIKDYMSEGGACYPFTQINFGEALSETGNEDSLVENRTEAEEKIAVDYWFDMAKFLAERDWER